MKTFRLMIVALALLALTACTTAVQTSSAVQVPIEVKLALNTLILAGAMYGLQLLFDYVHIDLRGLGAAVAAAVTEAAIMQLQGWIDLVPAQYDPVVTIGLQVLLAILVFLGGVRVFGQKERAKQLLASK